RGFEIASEIPAAAFHLSGFKPVHVVVNITHSSGEFFASDIQTRQTLRDSFPLPTGKQRHDFLVFTRKRAQNRIGLRNKYEQFTVQLAQGHFLACRYFESCEFVKTS